MSKLTDPMKSSFQSKWSINKNSVVIFVVLFVGLMSITGFWLNHRESQLKKSATALYLANQVFTHETELWLKEKPSSDFKDHFKKTISSYQEMIENFGNNAMTREAGFQLASFYYHHQSYQEALSWYQKLTKMASGLDLVLAYSGMAYSYESLKQFHEAVQYFEKAYQKIAPMNQEDLKVNFLFNIARNYEFDHSVVQARNIYDQIFNEFPNTSYAQTAAHLKDQLSTSEPQSN